MRPNFYDITEKAGWSEKKQEDFVARNGIYNPITVSMLDVEASVWYSCGKVAGIWWCAISELDEDGWFKEPNIVVGDEPNTWKDLNNQLECENLKHAIHGALWGF